MRRGGASYLQIGEQLGVGKCRAQQLVMSALREEAYRLGRRTISEEALDSIRFVKRRTPSPANGLVERLTAN